MIAGDVVFAPDRARDVFRFYADYSQAALYLGDALFHQRTGPWIIASTAWRLLPRLIDRLRPEGWLVLGVRESLPQPLAGLTRVSAPLGLYRRAGR